MGFAAVESEVRDGLIDARGASDDRTNLYILLRAVADLSRAGQLPVNVRFLFDGDEEATGGPAVEWLPADRGPVDAGIVLDGWMNDRSVPMLTVGARGSLPYKLRVRTGETDLHSGPFGGAGLKASTRFTRSLPLWSTVRRRSKSAPPNLPPECWPSGRRWQTAQKNRARLAGGPSPRPL